MAKAEAKNMIALEENDIDYSFYRRIVENAALMSDEGEWLEFKHSNADPDLIGQYLCALGNTACICQKDNGYLIYGIDDETHAIVGTTFNPSTAKKGGELLESYLSHMLSKNAFFQFVKLRIDGKNVVVGVSAKATSFPLSFAGTEYIRIGSSLKKLKDFPETERKLWLSLSVFDFESMVAKEHIEGKNLGEYLDLSNYYRLLGKPFPTKEGDLVEDLVRDGVIKVQDDGRYAILNCGALAIGRSLSAFPSLKGKGIRVICHNGEYLTSFSEDKTFDEGYALCLEEVVDFIESRAGREEVIDKTLRRSVYPYPVVAIREMIANAIIHQDLTVHGSGVVVHLFANRVSVTNPGELLCDIKRSIDALPKTRNEELARIVRKMGFVEEQGSGFDRIEEECALRKMPSIFLETDATKTTMTLYRRYGYREFDKQDIIRTCYTFACLRHFNGLETTNPILRERLGVEDRNAAMVSRILKECVDAGDLKGAESAKDKRSLNYVPFYA